MSNVIKIKKGLDIKLKGKALEQKDRGGRSLFYAYCPEDFPGLVPKVLVKAGESVKAGTPLMEDKNRPQVKFVSPVSGVVEAINRGERRRLLSVVVKAQFPCEYEKFKPCQVESLSKEKIREQLLAAGIWPFIKQRPFDVIADPTSEPRDIFITGFDSAPLAPSMDYVMAGQLTDFQTGVDALAKMTNGKIYLSLSDTTRTQTLLDVKRVETYIVKGPHPAGNVGIQINHIKPVNKGETVWTLSCQDVLFIGRLFNKGVVDLTRKVAITGSEITETGYTEMPIGGQILPMVSSNVSQGLSLRYISGNPLSGKTIARDGFLSAYAQQLTVIPEGDDCHELFGWALPGLDRYSVNHQYFGWLLEKLPRCFGFKDKEWVLDARTKGGERAMIVSEEYEKVFPMDILPEFLIKAILSGDIDQMEALGIYEVAPEDFALCEFVDTSKTEIQKIIRQGLDYVRAETV